MEVLKREIGRGLEREKASNRVRAEREKERGRESG
jgi:hypothetical protein